MPGGDKTGPTGSGAKTGRGLGYCADNDETGYPQGLGRGFRWGGRGRGFGNGRGRGWRNQSAGFSQSNMAADDQKIETLKAENRELRGVLQQILDKLDKLGS